MTTFLDMDGVICDLPSHLAKLHGFDQSGWPAGEYNIAAAFKLGMDFWHGTTADWWANAPKTAEADLIVQFALTTGVRIVVLTHTPYKAGCKNLDDCVAGKMRWLQKHYPNLPCSIVSGIGKDAWARGNLLIDDSDTNVREFRAAGGVAITVPRIWNSEHANRHRVLDFLYEEKLKWNLN